MFDLRKMRIMNRLIIAGLGTLIGLVLMTGYTVFQIRSDAIDAHKTRLRDLVLVTQGIVRDYQKLEASGTLSREEAQKRAAESLRTLRFGNDDYFFMYDFTGRAIMVAGSPKLEGQILLGKEDQKGFKFVDAFVDIAKNPGHGFVKYWFPRAGQSEATPKLGYIAAIPEWKMFIGTGVYIDDVDAVVLQGIFRQGSIAVIILLVIAWLSVLIARSIVRQLGGEPMDVIHIMTNAAAGNLSIEVQSARAGSILDSAGKMIASIRSMVADISLCSDHLTKDAATISLSAHAVAQSSEQQSEATHSMAAAIEQMTVSINHISDNMQGTRQNSMVVVDISTKGVVQIENTAEEIRAISSTVNEASAKIHQLESQAQKVSSIVAVIKAIAGQTNLLALNASIEAARAGEQGRGFAVVADEVGKLAERTSAATVEIEQMISSIQTDTVQVVDVMNAALPQVERGVSAAEETAEALRTIKEKAEITLSNVNDVASATEEQSLTSSNIAQRVEQIVQMAEENSTAMQSSAETAKEIEKISTELNSLVQRFRCQ